MRTINPRFLAAVRDLGSRKFTYAELAERYKVTQATISNWCRKAGLPQARRGRRRLLEPTAEHRRILELSRDLNGEQIARIINVSRQRVNQVLMRWSHLRPLRLQATKPANSESVTRRIRPLKDQVVSFRLTGPEIERISEVLRTLELAKCVSRSQGCRLVLLAAVDCPAVTLTKILNSVVPCVVQNCADQKGAEACAATNRLRLIS